MFPQHTTAHATPLRLLAFIGALAVALSISACDNAASNTGGADATPAASAASPAKKLTIAVSVPAADHGWTAGIGWWAQRAMQLYPDINWVYDTAEGPQEQIADIENMMAQQKLDGLVVLCTESAPLTPIAKTASDRNIFIVNVDRGFLEPVADIFLEGDNAAFGRKSAEFVAQRLEGKGKLVVLTGIPSTVDTARVEAAMKIFAQYPDIQILDVQPAMWNREKGLEVMQALLQKHPQIDAVWAQDDDIALGAEQAIRDAKRENEMWMLGGAGMKDIIKRVMENDPMYPADVTYPPAMIAAGIHLAVSSLRDGKADQIAEFMPRHLMIDVELVTPENAKQHYFPDSVY